MVEDTLAGLNYYELLGVDKDFTDKQLKKAHRTLGSFYHPDKNKDTGSVEKYHSIMRAYEILSSPEFRVEYDTMLEKGVRVYDRYYGRHVHRFGIPQHNPFYVLFNTLSIVTIFHYVNKWMVWNRQIRIMKQSKNYQRLVEEKRREERRTGQPTAGLRRSAEGYWWPWQELTEDVQYELLGTRPPTWRDLVVVQLFTRPFGIWDYFTWARKHYSLPADEQEEALHRLQVVNSLLPNFSKGKYHPEVLTDDQAWKDWKKDQMKLSAAKWKKTLRYAKKEGIRIPEYLKKK